MTESKPVNLPGIGAAFATPLFLGMAPIFGKIAITSGADGFTVAALRTIIAVLLLWSVYLLFFRRYIFIYPAGLLGCIIIGAINGIGSLFYYGGLELLDASLVQLINGSYLAFAVVLSRIGGQRANRRTLLRILLAMIALIMITGLSAGTLNWLGVGLMLANALMFAATVILSQYILYEMPSLTFTLYTLTTMGVVVTMVWLAISPPLSAQLLEATLVPLVLLGLTTALSRLAMFASVKFLGGMQTAILGITEIAVALLLAAAVLGETLTPGQWLGTALLFTSIMLIRQEDMLPHGFNPNALIVTNMASVQFQRIAFHRAFGTHELDNEQGTMSALTTQEILAIQRMMGASSGAIDPFPIGRAKQINPGYDSQEILEQILTSDPPSQPPDAPIA